MSETDRKKLREAAMKAAPGPWKVTASADSHVFDQCVVRDEAIEPCVAFCDDPTATFIALANPQTILALLDDLDRKTVGKQLEWGVSGADTGLGSMYYVRHYDDGTWGWHLTMGPEVPDRYSSHHEAKAAAQKDYEARIRSALAPSPAIGRERGALDTIIELCLSEDAPIEVGEFAEEVFGIASRARSGAQL